MSAATLATLRVDGVTVAEYLAGDDMPPGLAPRPYLHPVRTLSGVVVTDAMASDHPWHLGVSVAVQDVDGWNFWGGPTYVRGEGYVGRDDHGHIHHAGFSELHDGGFVADLRWLTGQGELLLIEERRVRCGRAAQGWQLLLTSTITNATRRPLRIGSPATNGRPGAGYGGLFWRLPQAGRPVLWSPFGAGEEAVHDSLAPWLAWMDELLGFTVVLASTDGPTEADPWFVRVADYPGVGLQLAGREPLMLPVGGGLTRGLRALVVDGPLKDGEVRAWAAGTGAAVGGCQSRGRTR